MTKTSICIIKLFIKQKIDKKVFFQICQSKAALSENEIKKKCLTKM